VDIWAARRAVGYRLRTVKENNRTKQRAIDYVLDLGPDRVTPAQKTVLRGIAEYYVERYGLALVGLDQLSADLLRTRVHLARVFKSLRHLIDYKPGLGSGNFSQFRFIELESATASERQHKGNISDAAIKEEKQNPSQNDPPGPLSSKGGTFEKLITVRQVRELRAQIDDAERRGLPRLAAIELACGKMLFPLKAAIAIFAASGHQEISEDLRTLVEENPRKRPHRVA
jgi:hypothetical protein